MATEIQLKQWKKELMAEFPNCEPFFIDLVLDLYKHNPDYVKKLPKQKVKPVEAKPLPKEIVGCVDVVRQPTADFIDKYFKKPIYLPPEEEQNK